MSRDEIAAAYDAIAVDYDALISDDEWIRRELWRHYARVFRSGQVVLDVSCGTGIDSLFLAHRGVRVVAADISLGMVVQLRRKLAGAGGVRAVLPCVQDSERLAGWRGSTFDGIVSSFAGLSTLPDLSRFAAAAASVLRPGGRMVLHLLARFSLWEWFGLIAHRRWAEARRLRGVEERSFPVGGRPLRHFMHLPDDTYRTSFAPLFALRQAYSLGSLRPPSDLRRVPGAAVRGLGRIETLVRRCRPFLNWGRSFVLDLERRSDAGEGGPND